MMHVILQIFCFNYVHSSCTQFDFDQKWPHLPNTPIRANKSAACNNDGRTDGVTNVISAG